MKRLGFLLVNVALLSTLYHGLANAENPSFSDGSWELVSLNLTHPQLTGQCGFTSPEMKDAIHEDVQVQKGAPTPNYGVADINLETARKNCKFNLASTLFYDKQGKLIDNENVKEAKDQHNIGKSKIGAPSSLKYFDLFVLNKLEPGNTMHFQMSLGEGSWETKDDVAEYISEGYEPAINVTAAASEKVLLVKPYIFLASGDSKLDFNAPCEIGADKKVQCTFPDHMGYAVFKKR